MPVQRILTPAPSKGAPVRPLPVPVPDANTGNLILVTAGMKEGALLPHHRSADVPDPCLNRTSKLADDRVLEQENECGYAHRHNAGEGEGGGDGRRIRAGW
jgi:hypothetical protein